MGHSHHHFFFGVIILLCSANTGKYLSGKYEEERAKAVEDKSLFSDEELDFLEITGVEGTGVHQEDTYLLDSVAVGSTVLETNLPRTDALDIREFPQMGVDK